MRIAGDCKGIIGGCIDSRRVYRDYRGSCRDAIGRYELQSIFPT